MNCKIVSMLIPSQILIIYIPVSEERIEIRRLSTDNVGSYIFLNDKKFMIKIHDVNDYKLLKYIACIYDQDWYSGVG